MNTINRRQLLRLSPDAAARLRAVAARAGRTTDEETDPAGAVTKSAKPPRTDYLTVKAALQERLLDEIGERGLLESEGRTSRPPCRISRRAHWHPRMSRSTKPSACGWPRS